MYSKDDVKWALDDETLRLAKAAGFQIGFYVYDNSLCPFVRPCVGTDCFVEIKRLIEIVRDEQSSK